MFTALFVTTAFSAILLKRKFTAKPTANVAFYVFSFFCFQTAIRNGIFKGRTVPQASVS